ncbi:MAG TPA: hypothetical protein VJ521_13825, partial [Acidobacteriota bacterium]|nr:hypothetical protein [Acidobacteriota bacterium]
KPIKPPEAPTHQALPPKSAVVEPQTEKSETITAPAPAKKLESKQDQIKRDEPKPAEIATVKPPAPAVETSRPKPAPAQLPDPDLSALADRVEPTTRQAPPVQPKEETIATTGMLIFFRPEDPFVGDPKIFLDSVELARLIKGHYFRVEVAPGPHLLSFEAAGYLTTGPKIEATFTGSGNINIEAGKEYYVKVVYEKYTMMWSSNPRMRELILRMKPVESKDIKNRDLVKVP